MKKTTARLLEAWADEVGVDLNGFGSWTLKEREEERGLEPDVPDIAIEVIWTHGGLDKLEIYRGLKVPEVWIWKDGELRPWSLGPEGYQPLSRSRLLPDVDLELIARFSQQENQSAAVRAFRAELRSRRGGA